MNCRFIKMQRREVTSSDKQCYRLGGFTLIELLVVIAIIALLLAILMPALQHVKSQAQAVACQARLKEWGLVYKLYTDDNDGYFPEGWRNNDERVIWINALRPYYKDNPKMLLWPPLRLS